jgi:hypothetical protein
MCVVKRTHRFDRVRLEHRIRVKLPVRGLSAASPVTGQACSASMVLGSMVTRMASLQCQRHFLVSSSRKITHSDLGRAF